MHYLWFVAACVVAAGLLAGLIVVLLRDCPSRSQVEPLLRSPGNTDQAVHLCFFGNTPKYDETLARITREAQESALFDSITQFTQNDMPASLTEYAKRAPRGFGYWRWKPMVVQAMMRRAPVGDLIVYADAGCRIRATDASRSVLANWLDQARQHPTHRVAFQMKHLERRWTKEDLFRLLGVKADNTAVRESGQYMATIQIYVNTHENQEFVARLVHLGELMDGHFIDDSPSTTPNVAGFSEHRHDQSIFSLMCKLEGVCGIPSDGNEFCDHTGDEPIHATRQRPR